MSVPVLSPPMSRAVAKIRSAATPNSPDSTDTSATMVSSDQGPNSPAPIVITFAKHGSAPVFNFPHTQHQPASQMCGGVGDSSPLQLIRDPIAKPPAAAALNLPTPMPRATAIIRPARGSNIRRNRG